MSRKTLRVGLASSLALSLALFAGCDENDRAGPDWLGDGPAYVVSTRVFTPGTNERTSYFHLVNSLEQGTTVDPAHALEIPGSARTFALEAIDWFAIGDGESPTITQYTLGAEGLEAGASISLQPQGVKGLWDTLYYVSPTKVYYPDRDNHQLVIINPTAMTVTGTIPLPTTARTGFLALYGYKSITRDGKLLFPVGWFDWTNDIVLDETGLVVIDTNTDTVSRVDVDTRCAGITTPVTLASGDTYFLTSALGAATYQMDRLDVAPCALRVLADADAFDATYAKPLGELVDGALAGEPVPAGGNAIFFRVFDEEEATIDPQGFSWDITGQTVWHWVRWDVAETTTTAVTWLQPSTADVVWFEADGAAYGTETDSSYSFSRFIELTAASGPEVRMSVPGFLQGLARLR